MFRTITAILLLTGLTTAPAAGLEVKPSVIDLKSLTPSAASADAAIELKLGDGTLVRVSAAAGSYAATLTPSPKPQSLPANALPDTEIAVGTRNISLAWLTQPTRRYDHGVLGDAVEAGGIAATLADGSTTSLTLDQDSVFEDRIPRLADLNGDGRDEILVVRSFLSTGAALTVVAPTQGALKIVAEAEPIGLAHRWLNPVGAADFDGDGRLEAAVVITPHIGGTLQLYEWKGARLVEDNSRHGFSNHAIGSRELGLSAITDINGDGVADIVLPDAGRAHLIGVSFAGGRDVELFRHPINGRLVSGIAANDLDADGRPEIAYVLSGGKLVVLRIK